MGSLTITLRTAVRRLELRDLPVLVEAWWALVRVDRQIAGAPGGSRLALDSSESLSGRPSENGEIERLDRLVRWAGRLVPGRVRCLHHSMALRRLLARRGFDARLEIGVRRELQGLCAHAWLEIDGRPLGYHGRGAEQFSALGLVDVDESEALS